MSKLIILLSIACSFSGDLLAQQDTVWLKYDASDMFFHDEVGKHPQDPHSEDYFPFTGLHGYRLLLSEKKFANTIYFVFASHGPVGTGIPFYYKKLNTEKLEQIYWLTGESLSEWSYLNIIRYFRNKNKVIMLYDTTQPPGEEQYVVRVYFSFDAWE
ncbi:MAG: hypothetical protein WBH03_17975 [Cyclobacteriaceae bacterium]